MIYKEKLMLNYFRSPKTFLSILINIEGFSNSKSLARSEQYFIKEPVFLLMRNKGITWLIRISKLNGSQTGVLKLVKMWMFKLLISSCLKYLSSLVKSLFNYSSNSILQPNTFLTFNFFYPYSSNTSDILNSRGTTILTS